MRVYFTVDTECSLGGAWDRPERSAVGPVRHIFCRIGGDEFGVPLLTRITREFGFRSTYFVETLAAGCVDQGDMRRVFDFLLGEEQDVQLHIHPVFRLYTELQKARREGVEYRGPQPADFIGHLDTNVQMEMLQEAIHNFVQCAGYRPAAFRAGCFAGSRSMLRCLKSLGIVVDSSFNPCYHPGISFPEGPMETNLVQKVEGVWEIPITVARTRLPEGYGGFKFADCTSLSFSEIRTMLDAAAAAGQEHFVIVFHSFSAVKTRDETYAEMRPNRIVIHRLKKMFQYLAENGDRFQMDTMGNIAQHPQILGSRAPGVIANLGMARAITRKTVQFLNNAYWV